MIRFSFLPKEQFHELAEPLFALLHANMEPMVPDGWTFDEWRAAVGDGLKCANRQLVLMNDDAAGLVGFFQYYVSDTAFVMEEIQIAAKEQCKGLLRRLYRWLIPQMEKRPQWVEAYTHPQNGRAQEILHGMGLAHIGNENGFLHYRGEMDDLLRWLYKGTYHTVLFDLDGTLTDPGLGITNSVMYALKKWGIEAPPRESLYRFIGPPLQDSFMQYAGFSREDAETSVAYYREYFREKGLYENEVYPGAEELLSRLKASGRKIALATSKPEEFAVKILRHFHLDGYFDVIAGATMDSSRSKKADVIAYCLERLGVTDLSGVVMVGDREHDVIGAETVGVDSIGVLVGYGSREELENAGADYIAQSLADVLALVDKKEH